MAKLKITFVNDLNDRQKDDVWTLDQADKHVTSEQAQNSLKRLKQIPYLKKSNGEPLFNAFKEVNAEILEESVVLSLLNI